MLDCKPGYATADDRIVVYPRAGVRSGVDARAQLDQTNAVWLFEPGPGNGVALLVDFHDGPGGGRTADLYDDGDGDGRVSFAFVAGIPKALEHGGRPTVSVTSLDGAWSTGGRPSFNLDIRVDGSVRASFWSEGFLDVLRNDGSPDFEIHVRDADHDGRPDLEWRQFEPPLPEDPALSTYVRTEITSNPEDDEVPITGSLFWPYLAASLPEDFAAHYEKSFGVSAPPIDVDWSTGRIVQIGEFVASVGNPGSSAIQSITRIPEGATTAPDFVSPFAFYDLAGVGDGRPDLSVRVQTTLPEEVLAPLRNEHQINTIEYSWGRRHDNSWTYALSLVGHQAVNDTIAFPEFSVRAVPAPELPGWVVGQQWDAATFVEVAQPFSAAEGISQYSVSSGDDVLARRYLTGIDASPPVGLFLRIAAGYRGEYAFDLRGRAPRLFLSPVDLRLHLVGAQGGVWNVGAGEEIRYASIAGDGIDDWTLLRDGAFVAELSVVDGQAILATGTGVFVGRVGDFPAETGIVPPHDRQSWSDLGALLDSNPAPFAPDDLVAMFDRLATGVQQLPHAAATDLRATADGFRFLLNLRDPAPKAPWAAGLAPGPYLVRYGSAAGFVAESVTPAAPAAGPVAVLGDPARAKEPTELWAGVENPGDTDATAVRVTFLAGKARADMQPIGTTLVDAPSDKTATARLLWTPPSGGNWFVGATIADSQAPGPLSVIAVAAAVDGGTVAILAAQRLSGDLFILALGLLLSGAFVAASWASRLLRP